VVIPVKNGERFLADALDSVVAQTYRDHEIIVVDGHSVDRTAEIAGSYEGVRCVCQAGHGLFRAYNSLQVEVDSRGYNEELLALLGRSVRRKRAGET